MAYAPIFFVKSKLVSNTVASLPGVWASIQESLLCFWSVLIRCTVHWLMAGRLPCFHPSRLVFGHRFRFWWIRDLSVRRLIHVLSRQLLIGSGYRLFRVWRRAWALLWEASTFREVHRGRLVSVGEFIWHVSINSAHICGGLAGHCLVLWLVDR